MYVSKIQNLLDSGEFSVCKPKSKKYQREQYLNNETELLKVFMKNIYVILVKVLKTAKLINVNYKTGF